MMFVEDDTYNCSEMNILEQLCILLELGNRYLKE